MGVYLGVGEHLEVGVYLGMAECLPSMRGVPGSIPSTARKNKNKEEVPNAYQFSGSLSSHSSVITTRKFDKEGRRGGRRLGLAGAHGGISDGKRLADLMKTPSASLGRYYFPHYSTDWPYFI